MGYKKITLSGNRLTVIDSVASDTRAYNNSAFTPFSQNRSSNFKVDNQLLSRCSAKLLSNPQEVKNISDLIRSSSVCIFFICYLAAAPPTLEHYGGNRLIYQFLCSQEPSVIWASNLSNLSYPASNYKFNNRNATARCQICSH